MHASGAKRSKTINYSVEWHCTAEGAGPVVSQLGEGSEEESKNPGNISCVHADTGSFTKTGPQVLRANGFR